MRTIAVFCAAIAFVLAATASSSAKVPGACAVTVPNGLGPPGAPTSGGFAAEYGNGRLGTQADGVIRPRPEPDGSLSWKFAWWGTREPRQPLGIVGRRLDPLTPLTAIRVHERFVASANEGYVESSPVPRFWSSTVTFPTEGCWRVTGVVGRVRLSVVVLVQTISSSSSSVK
jgi:hypothetical protein